MDRCEISCRCPHASETCFFNSLLKEAAIQEVNFPRLAVFRPGIIIGNAHTPRWVGWLGRLVPGPWGNIEQRAIGKAFVAEIAKKAGETGVAVYDNQGMRASIE